MEKPTYPMFITLQPCDDPNLGLSNTVTLLDDRPICIKCGKPSTKRCSKCLHTYYCSRECQVKDWKSHKVSCISPLKQVDETISMSIRRFGIENCSELLKWAHSVTLSKFISFGSYDLFSYLIGDMVGKPVIGINPEPILLSNTAARGPIDIRECYNKIHYQKYNPYTSISDFVKSEPDPSKYADSTLFLNWVYRQTDSSKIRETEMDAIEQLNPAIIISVFDKFLNTNYELLVALTQIPGLYSSDECMQVIELLKDFEHSDESPDITYVEILSKARKLDQYRLELSIDLFDYNKPDTTVDLSTAPDDIRYFITTKNNIISKTFTMIILVRNDIQLNNKVPKFKFDKKLCTSIVNRPESYIFNLYHRAFKYITEHVNLIKTSEDMKRYIQIVSHWIGVQHQCNIKLDDNPQLFKDLSHYLLINM